MPAHFDGFSIFGTIAKPTNLSIALQLDCSIYGKKLPSAKGVSKCVARTAFHKRDMRAGKKTIFRLSFNGPLINEIGKHRKRRNVLDNASFEAMDDVMNGVRIEAPLPRRDHHTNTARNGFRLFKLHAKKLFPARLPLVVFFRIGIRSELLGKNKSEVLL